MAREEDTQAFQNVAFQQLRIHDLDHHAIVTRILRGRKGRLKKYQRGRQRFPLQLAPQGEQDRVTRLFGSLREECEEADPKKKRPWNNWILEETWRLIAHRAMLHRTGCLCQTERHWLHRQIRAALHKDRRDRTTNVGESIVTKLAGGNIQEAFRHLKGWYQMAMETQSKP